MSYRLIKYDTLKGIADAIRSKSDKTDEIPITAFADEIANMSGGGGDPAALVEIAEALGTLAPTITINFEPTQSGEYWIGDGEHITFDNVSCIEIGYAPIGETITVQVYGDCDGYEDGVGCTVDRDWDYYGRFEIVPTDENASAHLFYYG